MSIRGLRHAFIALAAGFGAVALAEQTPQPQTYTMTLTSRLTLESMFSGAPTLLRVYRVGTREIADAMLAPQAGKTQGVHVRRWFNLQEHKVYTLDMISKSCSWMRYTPALMPVNYDPMAMPSFTAADLKRLNQPDTPRESVNGMPARILELTSEAGKSKFWLSEQGNYPLKVQMMGPDGKPMVVVEVKELHFDKTADALLNAPATCTEQASGVWDENGINASAETTIEVKGSGSADLKTGKTQGEATVKSGNQPR